MGLITQAVSSGARIASACEILGVSSRTYENWRKTPEGDQRRGPLNEPRNKLSERERNKVISIATSERYRDKSVSQIVPSLADEGEYVASESTFYRVLKKEKLNAHRGKSKPKSYSKPKEITASQPNEVWSWDITYLKSCTTGMFYYLYLVMDIYSRKIIGFELEDTQSSEVSSKMMRRLCQDEGISKDQLILHSDNGGPMKGATMLATLQKLGVVPSFSRPSVSDDNPYSESMFKTLKYCPMYPSKPFESTESAKNWVEKFIQWYNEEHLHSGISFVTPGCRHRGEDHTILEKRNKVYEKAKDRNPARWSKETRNWKKYKNVFLNKRKTSATQAAA